MDTKNAIIIGLALALVVGIVVVGATGKTESPTGETVKKVITPTGEVQEVTLSYKNYAYVLEPDTFVVDVPVRMTVDMSKVYGCMRDVVINSFGVRQVVSEGNNIIEFTPDKTGTFSIACSMNMGRGSFTVIEADGSTSDFVEAAPVGDAGSCGGGAGGCGCGGA